jgi:hypothetical protein
MVCHGIASLMPAAGRPMATHDTSIDEDSKAGPQDHPARTAIAQFPLFVILFA